MVELAIKGISSSPYLKRKVEICVKDNSQGISDSIKEKIFQSLLLQINKAGTGLGLSLAYDTVKAHGEK